MVGWVSPGYLWRLEGGLSAGWTHVRTTAEQTYRGVNGGVGGGSEGRPVGPEGRPVGPEGC